MDTGNDLLSQELYKGYNLGDFIKELVNGNKEVAVSIENLIQKTMGLATDFSEALIAIEKIEPLLAIHVKNQQVGVNHLEVLRKIFEAKKSQLIDEGQDFGDIDISDLMKKLEVPNEVLVVK